MACDSFVDVTFWLLVCTVINLINPIHTEESKDVSALNAEDADLSENDETFTSENDATATEYNETFKNKESLNHETSTNTVEDEKGSVSNEEKLSENYTAMESQIKEIAFSNNTENLFKVQNKKITTTNQTPNRGKVGNSPENIEYPQNEIKEAIFNKIRDSVPSKEKRDPQPPKIHKRTLKNSKIIKTLLNDDNSQVAKKIKHAFLIKSKLTENQDEDEVDIADYDEIFADYDDKNEEKSTTTEKNIYLKLMSSQKNNTVFNKKIERNILTSKDKVKNNEIQKLTSGCKSNVLTRVRKSISNCVRRRKSVISDPKPKTNDTDTDENESTIQEHFGSEVLRKAVINRIKESVDHDRPTNAFRTAVLDKIRESVDSGDGEEMKKTNKTEVNSDEHVAASQVVETVLPGKFKDGVNYLQQVYDVASKLDDIALSNESLAVLLANKTILSRKARKKDNIEFFKERDPCRSLECPQPLRSILKAQVSKILDNVNTLNSMLDGDNKNNVTDLRFRENGEKLNFLRL